MQPYIFPYIGYFKLIKAVETFIFYDDVNFIKRGWVNRNKILINGEESLITFPCLKASQNKEIREIQINLSDNMYDNILKTVYHSYHNAPFFNEIFTLIKNCIESDSKTISELSILSVTKVCNYLDIKTDFEISSLNYSHTKGLDKAQRLIELVKVKKATKYINAIGGQKLYTKEYFKSFNLDLLFLKPIIEEYKQFENQFVPNLSIIDVLMFNSVEEVNLMLDNYELI